MEVGKCPQCGKQSIYIEKYNNFYCYHCRQYYLSEGIVVENPAGAPPEPSEMPVAQVPPSQNIMVDVGEIERLKREKAAEEKKRGELETNLNSIKLLLDEEHRAWEMEKDRLNILHQKLDEYESILRSTRRIVEVERSRREEAERKCAEIVKEKEELNNWIEKSEQDVENLNLELKRLTESLEEKRQELDVERKKIKEYEIEFKKTRAITDIKVILEKEMDRRDRLQEEITKLEKMREVLKKERSGKEELMKELKKKEDMLTSSESELEKIKDKIEELRKEKWKREYLEEEVSKKDKKLEELMEERKKLMNDEEELRKQLSEAIEKCRQDREKVEELTNTLKAREGDISGLRKKLNDMEVALPVAECPVCSTTVNLWETKCPNCNAEFQSGELLFADGKSEGGEKDKAVEADREKLEMMKKEMEHRTSEIENREKELENKLGQLVFKEETVGRRELEIAIMLERAEEEKKFIERLKKEFASETAITKMHDELAQMADKLKMKEEELREKERYLLSLWKELDIKKRDLKDTDISEGEEVRLPGKEITKVKIGVSRLDDLLYGGVPIGSNILLCGAAFIGKETLSLLYIAAGLKKEVPCLVITLDHPHTETRSKLMELVPDYQNCEKKGYIRYIDMYTARTNSNPKNNAVEGNVDSIEDLKNVESINKAIDKNLDIISQLGSYYRVSFPISTLLINLESLAIIKLLERTIARIRGDKSVCLYDINSVIHSEKEVETIKHIMDGSIELRVKNLQKSLSILGLSNVQTRGWVNYTHTETSFVLGSFTVSRIR